MISISKRIYVTIVILLPLFDEKQDVFSNFVNKMFKSFFINLLIFNNNYDIILIEFKN